MVGCLAGAAGAALDLEKKPPPDDFPELELFELPPIIQNMVSYLFQVRFEYLVHKAMAIKILTGSGHFVLDSLFNKKIINLSG
jgi:hypothetical protein